jgi:uncharacterized membrane protein
LNTYLILKCVHIVSSTVLFGTGIGIAFFKWMTDRTGDVRAIRLINERTVLADWLFTTPAVILQPVTGIWLAQLAGFPLFSGWVAYAIGLYLLAAACWLPVVYLQLRMRTLAGDADDKGIALPAEYNSLARVWFLLGFPAFFALVAVYWLMVFKPQF